jgi:hypothetical protein
VDEAAFWDLIDATRPAKASKSQHLSALRRRLRSLPADDIASFQRHLDAAMADAQDRNLWAAAILIRGICTDDGFIYFCLWLISRGRAVYSAALVNPDTLAGVVNRGGMSACQFEELWGVAKMVYEQVASREMPLNDVQWPDKPRGEWYDLDDAAETSRRFPLLSARFAEPGAAADGGAR